jgi:lipoyl(octanoyl) transferase
MIQDTVNIRFLGVQDYLDCWQKMKSFTDHRDANTTDEIWLVEHPAVYTQGQNGKVEHLLNPGNIPVIAIDRGGQVTFHGPGQLLAYTLIDVKRKKFKVRQVVTALEQSVIELLALNNIVGKSKCEAPGVYVEQKKICSVGLRIRKGCAYHGLALNVAMDLNPFLGINPCGYAGLQMTQLSEWMTVSSLKAISLQLIECLSNNLGYTKHNFETDTP